MILDFGDDLEISLVELLDTHYEVKMRSNMNSDGIEEIQEKQNDII